MNIFMYTNRFGVYMAGKLYWRIKKDGKWTWTRAYADHVLKEIMRHDDFETMYTQVRNELEEEE